MVNSTQTWLIYRGNSPLVCENNVMMWVKQCHKPIPSHHSFYIIGGINHSQMDGLLLFYAHYSNSHGKDANYFGAGIYFPLLLKGYLVGWGNGAAYRYIIVTNMYINIYIHIHIYIYTLYTHICGQNYIHVHRIYIYIYIYHGGSPKSFI
jgi:hypothetical protein